MEQLILFGAGYMEREAFLHFGKENVCCFCDNRIKAGTREELYGKDIISFQKMKEICSRYVIVICVTVSGGHLEEICRQLEQAGISHYLIYPVLMLTEKDPDMLTEQLRDKEMRQQFYIRYYKTFIRWVNGQLQYLKRHVDITTLKPATGALRKRQRMLLEFSTEFMQFADSLNIKLFLNFGNLVGAVRHQGFVPWDDDMDFGIMRSDYEKMMEAARQSHITGTLCGKIWTDIKGNSCQWEEMLDTVKAGQYIFKLTPQALQVYKGDGSVGIDIWVYDYYKDGMDIVKHKKWLGEISGKLNQMKDDRGKIEFLERERAACPWISNEKTGTIYPGIDNYGGYPGLKTVDRWMREEDIFPLRKVRFENTQFWAPDQIEAMLAFEYNDFMELPDDLGLLHTGTYADERDFV